MRPKSKIVISGVDSQHRVHALRFSLRVIIAMVAFAALAFHIFRQHQRIIELVAEAEALTAETRQFLPIPFDDVAVEFKENVLANRPKWGIYSISYLAPDDKYQVIYAPAVEPDEQPPFKLSCELRRNGDSYVGVAATKRSWVPSDDQIDGAPIRVRIKCDPRYAPKWDPQTIRSSWMTKIYQPR